MLEVEPLHHVRAHLVVVLDGVEDAHIGAQLVAGDGLDGTHGGAAVAVALEGVGDVEFSDVGDSRQRQRQVAEF